MLTFGQRVKKLRTEQGLTQGELAKKAGYASYSSISKIEQGKRDVPRIRARKLAKILNVDFSYLADCEKEKK